MFSLNRLNKYELIKISAKKFGMIFTDPDNATGLLLEDYISCQDIIAACEGESKPETEPSPSPSDTAKSKRASALTSSSCKAN